MTFESETELFTGDPCTGQSFSMKAPSKWHSRGHNQLRTNIMRQLFSENYGIPSKFLKHRPQKKTGGYFFPRRVISDKLIMVATTADHVIPPAWTHLIWDISMAVSRGLQEQYVVK